MMFKCKSILITLTLVFLLLLLSNQSLARFMSVDPVGAQQHIQAGNLQGFNRFAYANNNPYKYVDPDGQDVVFAVDPKAAWGNGHTSLYFQDSKGNWNSYNQGAAGETASGGNLGFVTGQDAKAGVSIQSVTADSVPKDGLILETTSKQDSQIAGSAEDSMKSHNSGDTKYNLYSNNCTDPAVDVVNNSGAGITVSNPATTVKPNSWIREVKSNPEAVKVEKHVKN